MKVLFLDDSPLRTKYFLKKFPDAKTVETANDCIKKISRNRYDAIFLDHDLGGEEFCNSGREDCGMEVVRWVVQNKPDQGEFIVHSTNTVAGPIMVEDLKRAGYLAKYIPFRTLVKGLNYPGRMSPKE